MIPQGAPPEPVGPDSPTGQGESTDVLHQHALAAEKHLEQLATGLAHAGIDKGVTSAVSKMADSMRKIVAAMGKTQPPPDAAAAPAPRDTMASATDALVNNVRANRPA